MKLLNEIVENTRKLIELKRNQVSIADLNKSALMKREVSSFSNSIREGSGIIAEYKRRSPSAGEFKPERIENVIQLYDTSQVSAISILTNEKFFNGTIKDIQLARSLTSKPILRKEFIVDEYQVFEAKAFGADAILLIAAILDEYHIKYLTTIAHSIGLEVLLEIHSHQDLEKINDEVDVIGVNNRNLDTLKIDLNHSEELGRYLPFKPVRISESGIRTAEDIETLSKHGYQGFLIGESVLKEPKLLKELIEVRTIKRA